MADAPMLLRGATIVDGSGSAPEVGDVLIAEGVIKGVGRDIDGQGGATVVDLHGLTLTPGYIDVHSHDDLAVLRPAYIEPKLRQGITTVIVGNCGHGCAPSAGPALASYSKPILGSFPDGERWPKFADYLRELDAEPRVTNVAALVPHGALRTACLGPQRRAADDQEIQQLAAMLDEALSAGAAGLSLGLMYAPGNSASADEIEALGRVLARRGRPLVAHMRNEADHLLASIDEVARIAQASGCSLHISHLKATGRKNHGVMPRVVERLDHYREIGLRLTADIYPYTAGSTTATALLPPWTQEEGIPSLLANLEDADCRRRVESDLRRAWDELDNHLHSLGSSSIVLTGFKQPAHRRYEGRTLSEISREMRASPEGCLVDLVLAEQAELGVIVHQAAEEDLRTAIAWPWTMVGTDGLPVDGTVHPRLYGTYPRMLTRYVDVLGLGETIRRMTSLPADTFGLVGRGTLEVGMAADIVVLAPERLRDRSSYESPRQYPAGIPTVFVNGRPGWTEDRGVGRTGAFLRVGE